MPVQTKDRKRPQPDISERLARLREVIGDARDIRVLIYGNPDPDALASALALKRILKEGGNEALIGYTGAIGRPENASMIRQLRIPAYPMSASDVRNADRIAVVDAQPQFFKDFQLPRCDMVIDHHPPLLDRPVSFTDIRPNYLSTSSIMTEYLRAADIRLTRRMASALFYGIKTDSRHFMGDLSQGDVEAIRWLRKRADREIVKTIEYSQFTREALDYFSIALVRRRFVKGVMYTHLGPVPFMDVCVQVADFLIRVENVKWGLVTGIVGDTLVVVFRNDGIKKDAGFLARAAFGDIGSAGGHKSMGRAEIRKLPPGVILTDNKAVERFVIGSLAKVDQTFAPILRTMR